MDEIVSGVTKTFTTAKGASVLVAVFLFLILMYAFVPAEYQPQTLANRIKS